MNKTDLWTVATIIGMALVTVITRSFFFLSSKPWSLPVWRSAACTMRPSPRWRP